MQPAVLGAKAALVAPVPACPFGWARDRDPAQPVTSGIWLGDWSDDDLLTPIQRIQIDGSDVVSFHNYGRANGSGNGCAACGASGDRSCVPDI